MNDKYDLNAEKYVLGCCMIDNEYIATALETLEIKDFYDELHRRIFSLMIEFYQKDIEINDVFVYVSMKEDELLKNRGGKKYIDDIMSFESAFAFESNIKLLKELSKSRALQRLLIQAQQRIAEDDLSSDEILEGLEQATYKLLALNKTEDSSASLIKEDVEKISKDLCDMAQHKEKVNYIKTGYKCIDDTIKGFGKGELVILAARQSMGKSTMSMNIAENIAIRGGAVVFFSLEMTRDNLIRKLMASITNSSSNRFIYGGVTVEELKVIEKAKNRIAGLPIYIDNTPNISLAKMRSRLRKIDLELKKQGKNIELVVVDYLQRIRDKSIKKDNRNLEIGEMTNELKNIALELNLPILCLSQLNREVDKRPEHIPIPSDLRDSGNIEQDADKILFLVREGYYKKDDEDAKWLAKLVISKNRNGNSDTILNLKFNPLVPRFEDLDNTL